MPARDPRAAWTPADYTKCAELVKQDTSDGFPVKISKPYFIGKYEVTQGQWQKVKGKNPSVFQGDKVTDDAQQHPVENVTWEDAQVFVKKLNALEKTDAYHLPSEFQWEYACRAGGSGQQSWAYIRETAVEGVAGFGAGAAAGAQAPKRPTTGVVGSKQPNAWGVYDMLGNVWEWVEDPYNEKIFADPVPANSGSEHVLKGGGFLSDLKNTICATHGGGPGDRWDVGFRVVKDSK
jgi:formylglycine-generating enzyme required for sulfatase activity